MQTYYAKTLVWAMMLFASQVGAQGGSQSDLVAALRSSKPQARASAFQQLSRMRGGLSAPGVADALASALEMENDLEESTFRGSNGTRGIADVYGEDYTEYVAQLATECAARCDLSNPRVALILAKSVDAESPVAARLARANGPALLSQFSGAANGPDMMAQVNALAWLANIAASSNALTSEQTEMIDSSLVRCVMRTCPDVVVFNALRSIGTIVGARPDLAPSRRLAFHNAVVASTSRGDEDTRFSAVEALAAFRDPSDLALLQHLRDTDTKRIGAAAAAASARIRPRAP